MHGGSQLDEKKHAIDCLEFYWFTKYAAQNDLVDLSHSTYHF